MREPSTVVDRFAQQVARVPDEDALLFEDRAWTYREIDEYSNRLAHTLRRRGVGPDVLVAIHMERSADFLLSILAVLKAGGAYVPLDSSYPTGRLEMMLEEASPLLLLTQEAFAGTLALPAETQTVVVDREEDLRSEEADAPPDGPMSPEDLAYVLFTSGSTGRPKGVAMPHGPLARLIDWQCARSELGTSDRTLQFSALSFDVSFQEIFSTWCSGGTLVLVSEADRKDAPVLLRLLETERIQRLFLPFVALQHIAEMAQGKDLYPSHLREVITAGEQLKSVPSVRAFFRRLPECSLENQYGPTESHVVTAYRLPGDVDSWDLLPPIGRAIPSARIHLLDEEQRPVSDGETGEIYIGGDCLAREYLNRPDQTAQRFLADPFSGTDGDRLYRTGDLARYRADGALEYLGRADHQVKIRGYRVELGEIEAVLSRHECVREAVVMPDQGETQGNQGLIAFVIAAPNCKIDPSGLREYLDGLLPSYMVPSAYVEIDAFPLTPSGKVDRKGLLSRPRPTPPRHRRNVVAPREELERILVGLWEEALGIRPIGIRDDFFSLGGHSIMAAEMLAKLSSFLGRDLPLSLLADTPTIEALAQKLRTGEDRKGWSILVPIRTGGSKPPLFCIHGGGQQVLRFRALSDLLDEDQPVYGLQWAGLDGGSVPSTIEAVADLYLREIRTVQPEGPYLLAGHCFGGAVAYHIAKLLRERGESVDMLIMLDPAPIGPDAPLPSTLARELAKSIAQHWRTPRRLLGSVRWFLALGTRLRILHSLLIGRPLSPNTKMSMMGRPGMASLFRLFGTPIPVEAQGHYAVQRMETALRRYRPAPLPVPTVVFHREGGPDFAFDEKRSEGDRPQSSDLRSFYEIDADHNSIIHHPRTAHLLAAHLEAAHTRIVSDRPE